MASRPMWADALLATAVAGSLLAIAVLLQREEEVAGHLRIIDGDTLAIDGRRIRIKGIDAPELAQTCERAGAIQRCGETARDALRALTEGAPVMCRVSGRDRWGRDLALCRANGGDVGAAMVRQGLAVAFGGYEPEERDARARGVGVWAGTFETPSAWRKRHLPGPQ